MERPISSRHHRNEQERERRLRMRNLCNTLVSLLPPQPTRATTYELMGQANGYIRNLKERIEAANERKSFLRFGRAGCSNGNTETRAILKLTSRECYLEVNIITGTNKTFMLHEVISLLQQEGAEVVTISIHNTGDKTIHFIHSQAISSRIGLETSRIEGRLMDLLH